MAYLAEVIGIGITFAQEYADVNAAITAAKNLLDTDERYQVGFVKDTTGVESTRVLVGRRKTYQPVVPFWNVPA